MSGSPEPPADAPSASDQLTQAIRRVVREELQRPEPPAATITGSGRESLAVAVLIVNLLLVYTYLPLNKDLVDFAKFLAAGLGGGLAIANPGAARRLIRRWTERPAFIPGNVALLVLLVGLRFGPVPVRFDVDPPVAVVIVDEDKEHPRRSGERVWLTIAAHKLRVQPGSGAIIVGDEQAKIEDRNFTLSWRGVVGNALPWTRPLRLALLSPVSISLDPGGRYRVQLRSAVEFDDAFRESSPRLTFDGDTGASITVNGDGTSVFLPFGVYEVTAVAVDGSATCIADGGKLVLDGHGNAVNLKCGT